MNVKQQRFPAMFLRENPEFRVTHGNFLDNHTRFLRFVLCVCLRIAVFRTISFGGKSDLQSIQRRLRDPLRMREQSAKVDNKPDLFHLEKRWKIGMAFEPQYDPISIDMDR